MARIALVWEMGGGFGHVARLDLLAKTLAARGHTVTIVAQQPDKFLHCAGVGQSSPYQLRRVQAFTPPLITLPRPSNFSEVLLSSGYDSVEWLRASVQEWRATLRSLSVDLAVYDYAPTAQLASKDLGFAQVTFGDGFCVPPRCNPMPPFFIAQNPDGRSLRGSDELLVHRVNSALRPLSIKPVTQVGDITEADGHFLTTIPELDPYANLRTDERYFGHLGIPAVGSASLNWSDHPARQRVFGYLKPDYPHLKEFVKKMAEHGLEARIYIPDLPIDLQQRYQTEDIQFSNRPFIMNSAYSAADFAVCHGGHATMLHSMQAGIPILGIPLQTEQFMTIQRCIDVGMARGLNPHDKLGIHQELKNIQALAAMRAPETKLGATSAAQRETGNIAELAVASEALIRA